MSFLPADEATRARQEMTDNLVAAGTITEGGVEREFRTVPRDLFIPADTAPEAAYNPSDAVSAKSGPSGDGGSRVVQGVRLSLREDGRRGSAPARD